MATVRRFYSGDLVLFEVEGLGQVQGTVEMMPSPTEVVVSNGTQYRRHPDDLRLIRIDQSRRTVIAIQLLYAVAPKLESSPEEAKLVTQALDVLDPTGLIRQHLDTAKEMLKVRNTVMED